MATSYNNAPGLLKGVDLTQKDWYSDQMSPSVELSEEGYFFEAAKIDAALLNWNVEAYLNKIQENLFQALRDGDVFGHTNLKSYIQHKVGKMGSLSFITGSRNIGKTRLLTHISEEYKGLDNNIMLVYVNGRDGDLATGIKKALKDLQDKQWFEGMDWEKIVKKMQGVIAAVEVATYGLVHMLSLLQSTGNSEDAELVSLVAKLAEQKEKNPCLIIDEANRVAKADTDTALLNRIIKLTKEELNLSVILCTSVNSYPDVVQKAFNVEFATSSLAEELPPTVMLDILTTAKRENGDEKNEKLVGMGPNLARLCVASCGGNLLRVKSTIEQLVGKNERFTPLDSIYRRLEGVREIAGLMEDTECKTAIIALAKKGFFETTKKTKALETKLVESGVASKVHRDDLIEESPLLEGCPRAFLVPSSQSLRAYIVATYPDEFKP